MAQGLNVHQVISQSQRERMDKISGHSLWSHPEREGLSQETYPEYALLFYGPKFCSDASSDDNEHWHMAISKHVKILCCLTDGKWSGIHIFFFFDNKQEEGSKYGVVAVEFGSCYVCDELMNCGSEKEKTSLIKAVLSKAQRKKDFADLLDYCAKRNWAACEPIVALSAESIKRSCQNLHHYVVESV